MTLADGETRRLEVDRRAFSLVYFRLSGLPPGWNEAQFISGFTDRGAFATTVTSSDGLFCLSATPDVRHRRVRLSVTSAFVGLILLAGEDGSERIAIGDAGRSPASAIEARIARSICALALPHEIVESGPIALSTTSNGENSEAAWHLPKFPLVETSSLESDHGRVFAKTSHATHVLTYDIDDPATLHRRILPLTEVSTGRLTVTVDGDIAPGHDLVAFRTNDRETPFRPTRSAEEPVFRFPALPLGTYALEWCLAPHVRQTAPEAVVVIDGDESTVTIAAPRLELIEGIIDAWDVLPPAVRPTRIEMRDIGAAAIAADGRFRLEVFAQTTSRLETTIPTYRLKSTQRVEGDRPNVVAPDGSLVCFFPRQKVKSTELVLTGADSPDLEVVLARNRRPIPGQFRQS